MGSIQDIMKDDVGIKVISVILGLGLAAIFRKTCVGNGCVVVKSPGKRELDDYIYKLQDDCYKYTPYAVKCGEDE
jgi:hypothetical protein